MAQKHRFKKHRDDFKERFEHDEEENEEGDIRTFKFTPLRKNDRFGDKRNDRFGDRRNDRRSGGGRFGRDFDDERGGDRRGRKPERNFRKDGGGKKTFKGKRYEKED